MLKIKGIIKLIRPVNLLIIFVVIYISAFLCASESFPISKVIIACIAALLTGAGGNIVNDYMDIEIDKINRPLRPLPSGRISKHEAIVLYSISTLAALLISVIISFSSFVIVAITIIMLFLYSLYFKAVPLIGNIVIAVCTGLAFIYGGIVVNNVEKSIIPAIFAFLINLIREILKDIEDVEGDMRNNLSTIAVKFGKVISKRAMLTVIITLITFTFYPFISNIYNIEYFIIVLFLVNIPLIYFTRSFYVDDSNLNISRFSGVLKIIMVTGLIAIYAGLV